MININYIKKIDFIGNDLIYNSINIYLINQIQYTSKLFNKSAIVRYAFLSQDFGYKYNNIAYRPVSLNGFFKLKQQYVRNFS